MKKTIAVFFGGRSPEHDVSVVSGLQVLNAIDTSQYAPFPVYIAPNGNWYVGEALKDQNNYMFDATHPAGLTQVDLDLSSMDRGALIPRKTGLFARKKPIYFDIAMPVFHGLVGEDGAFQGLMEVANIPYTGMRKKACSVFMDKDATKKALAGLDIPQLPYVAIERPQKGLLVDEDTLTEQLKKVGLPCCVKPAHLGSSIGVGKAKTVEDARLILSDLFRWDTKAIIEPFVENLVEYNVALRVNKAGEVETSVIERPKTAKELLDFKEKYMADDGNGKKGPKKGVKNSGTISQGLLALTREFSPDLPDDVVKNIKDIAVKVFAAYAPSGAPRIDFIGNEKTGEIWFNELNPIPGSYGYFLWEAADNAILFTDFLNELIAEAENNHQRHQLPFDVVPEEARLLTRRT